MQQAKDMEARHLGLPTSLRFDDIHVTILVGGVFQKRVIRFDY